MNSTDTNERKVIITGIGGQGIVFLTRLLSLRELRIERKPSVSWNDLIAGYELRGFTVALD